MKDRKGEKETQGDCEDRTDVKKSQRQICSQSGVAIVACQFREWIEVHEIHKLNDGLVAIWTVHVKSPNLR